MATVAVPVFSLYVQEAGAYPMGYEITDFPSSSIVKSAKMGFAAFQVRDVELRMTFFEFLSFSSSLPP